MKSIDAAYLTHCSDRIHQVYFVAQLLFTTGFIDIVKFLNEWKKFSLTPILIRHKNHVMLFVFDPPKTAGRIS